MSRFATGLLLLAAGALCAASGTVGCAGAEPLPDTFTAEYREAETFRVQPGDDLRVTVAAPGLERILDRRESALDRTVRSDGCISLPFGDDLKVTGATTAWIRDRVAERYAARLGGVRVDADVTVARNNSQVYYVFGEVVKVGRYPHTGRLTVIDGVTVAGGFNERASHEVILVRPSRDGHREENVVYVNVNELTVNARLDENYYLQPGDILIARRSLFAVVADWMSLILSPVEGILSGIAKVLGSVGGVPK
ncbi:MAG: polysaccharide biosynthesis/export family protein [Planctomycetes bacterium]|nr:polysaccharide biosynthesis/export family protein [Planctomycetota bacterium]